MKTAFIQEHIFGPIRRKTICQFVLFLSEISLARLNFHDPLTMVTLLRLSHRQEPFLSLKASLVLHVQKINMNCKLFSVRQGESK